MFEIRNKTKMNPVHSHELWMVYRICQSCSTIDLIGYPKGLITYCFFFSSVI